MLNASEGELKQIVQTSGIALSHDSTKVAVIPSGFIVMIFTEVKCFGVRWSLSSDANDNMRVRRMLGELTSSYKEMAAPSVGLTAFQGYLETTE